MVKQLYFKTILAAILCVIASITTYGKTLTPEQALSRIYAAGDVKKIGGNNARTLALKYTGHADDARVSTYVFADEKNGFIVAPADDELPAVIGYGSDFDADDIPPAMIEWMENCAHSTLAPMKLNHAAIEPLVKTQWAQRQPFYNQCPFDSENKRCLTGCVATALAQIVNYYKHPADKGIGSTSYEWNGRTLSYDYAATSFDWDNMLDSYKDGYTDAEADAVAKLMYAMGVGVHMNYTATASGAFSTSVVPFLYNHMGFDKNASLRYRNYFTAEEWDSMIYAELAAGRPLIYDGKTADSGHCFICDGYDGNGYYHFNWGWAGTSDGYFLLTNLNPYDQGDGSSEGGYNIDQTAVTGLMHTGDDVEVFMPLYANGGFEYSKDYLAFRIEPSRGFFNYSTAAVSFTSGIKLLGEDGEAYYLPAENITFKGVDDNGKFDSGRTLIPVDVLSNVGPGTYEATPVARLEGSENWQKIFVPVNKPQSVSVRVGANGAMACDGADPDQIDIPVKVTEITKRTNFSSGQLGRFSVVFNNTRATVSDVKCYLYFKNKETGEFTYFGPIDYALQPGETTKNVSANFTMPNGRYAVYAFDSLAHAKISDLFEMAVGVDESGINEADVTDTVTVKYFNLQGVAVEHPMPGHIYIETGNTGSRLIKF